MVGWSLVASVFESRRRRRWQGPEVETRGSKIGTINDDLEDMIMSRVGGMI